MITVNIFGDCVCRDCCTPLVKSEKIQVLQYPGHSNPISMFTPKIFPDIYFKYDNTDIPISNFHIRQMRLDYNKEFWDYFYAKKSDYVLVSFSNNRLDLFKNGDGMITSFLDYKKFPDEYRKYLKLNECESISGYDIPMEQHYKSIDRSIKELLSVYQPSQLIYVKHFGAKKERLKDGSVKKLSPDKLKKSEKFNELENQLSKYFISQVPDCHVIEFPPETLANVNHAWGRHMLHYVDEYYEYGSKALEVIFKKLPREEEQKELDNLLDTYKSLMSTSSQFGEYISNTQGYVNASKLLKIILDDVSGEGKLYKFIKKLKRKRKKVALLKVKDMAGDSILKIFNKYGVNIIFQNQARSIASLNEKDWEACRKADVILRVDAHSKQEKTRDGITEINIHNIFE